MRFTSIFALFILVITITCPAYANSSNNNFYSDGMPNGRMWTEVTDIGDKQATFFKLGFVAGYASGKSEAVIRLSASDLNQDIIDDAISIMSDDRGYSVNIYIQHLDDFYSDSRNLKIPMAVAMFCINRKLTTGNLVEFRALVTEYQKSFK